MSYYVDKGLLKKLLMNRDNPRDIGWVLQVIDRMTEVEIPDDKQGVWLNHGYLYICSKCNTPTRDLTLYCPTCGSKMEIDLV